MSVLFDTAQLGKLSTGLVRSSNEYLSTDPQTDTDFATWLMRNRPAQVTDILRLFFATLETAVRPLAQNVLEPEIPPEPDADALLGNPRLNERQIRAIRFMAKNRRITNADLRKMYPELSGEALRQDMADLVDKGMTLKFGDKRGTFYMLRLQT